MTVPDHGGAAQSQWEVITGGGDFKNGSTFSNDELGYGQQYNVWPVGIQVKSLKSDKVLIYKGRRRGWIDQNGNRKMFHNIGDNR